MEHLPELGWLHQPLSSLIALSCKDEVIIHVEQLVIMTGVEMRVITENGKGIAERCTQKFATGPQPWYNWHVEYEPISHCFIATKRNSPSSHLHQSCE